MSQLKLHVKKGDNVYILTGKDAGKKGKVLQALPSKKKVVVEGVNIVKRHTRPSQSAPQGGIVEQEAPIDSSNVMLVCGKCDKPTRITKKFADDRYYRACKKCGELFDK